jgi:hypothetical protein
MLALSCGGRVSALSGDAGAPPIGDADVHHEVGIDPPEPDAAPQPGPDPACDDKGRIPFDASGTARNAGVVFNGSEDAPGLFFCVGTFRRGELDRPLSTFGPIGGVGYGEAITLPRSAEWDASVRYTIVIAWALPTKPGDCSSTWSAARADSARYAAVADYSGGEDVYTPFVSGMIGCRDPARCTRGPALVSTIAQENAVTEGAYGEPGTTLQGWSLLVTPSAYRMWLRTKAGETWPLVVPEGGLAIPTSVFADSRLVLAPTGTKPCIECDGRPSSRCSSWSPLLSTVATGTADPYKPGRVLVVVFGAPEVASGPGSLRSLFIPY